MKWFHDSEVWVELPVQEGNSRVKAAGGLALIIAFAVLTLGADDLYRGIMAQDWSAYGRALFPTLCLITGFACLGHRQQYVVNAAHSRLLRRERLLFWWPPSCIAEGAQGSIHCTITLHSDRWWLTLHAADESFPLLALRASTAEHSAAWTQALEWLQQSAQPAATSLLRGDPSVGENPQ